MNDRSVMEIAAALRAKDFPPRFDDAEARLLIKLLQLVAAGSPVPHSLVEEAATSLLMPLDSAASFVDKLCERDGEGNLVGILGLSQRNCTLGECETWCRIDI